MLDTPQMNGNGPSFASMSAALQQANKRVRILEEENRALKHRLKWEDELFAHPELSPGQKLAMRSLYEPIASGTHGSQPIEIWRIAKQTGQSDKTVGKAIQFLGQNGILKRDEQHDRVTQKTQISIEVVEPLKHPKLLQLAAPRNHGGHRDPKPKCPACGSDLEIETAVRCTECGMKHTVAIRPATEHDTPLAERFTELSRIDRQLSEESGSQDDGYSPLEPDETTIVEGTLEPPSRAAVKMTAAPIETEETSPEESSDLSHILLSEESSDAPAILPNTPLTQQELQAAAQLLVELAGPGPKPEHVEMNPNYVEEEGGAKYYTVHRQLTSEDAQSHLQGRYTKGATLQYPGGLARAICFDADNPQDWQRLKEAALLLALAGFKPIVEPSPVRTGKHVGGGHLWVIFEHLVNAYAAYRTLCYRASMLSEVKEYWPNTDARVRLPGGKYVKRDFEAWCFLYDAFENELSHDGAGAARVLLQYQSPVHLLVIAEKPLPPKTLPPVRKQSYEQSGQSLVRQVIDDFNDTHSWEDIASLCGGFNRQKKFAAIWRGDRTPNVSVNPKTDKAKDFSTDAWLPYPMDKYQVWCLIDGGQNWEEFRRRDLAQRCAVLEGLQSGQMVRVQKAIPLVVQPASETTLPPINQSELQALAQELGATIGDPCSLCSCSLYWDRQGEPFCCRCYPKPRADWSEDAYRRLKALPRKAKEAW